MSDQALSIEIVSDVMCPWCVIGYKNLEKALENLPEVKTEITWHPFELNPDMGEEGQNLLEHLTEKYQSSEEELLESQQRVIDLGKDVGFTFNFSEHSKIFNSFDCHRLLMWAAEAGQQTALKLALFEANFTHGKALNAPEQLLAVVDSVGLDVERAKEILAGEDYKGEVRAQQQLIHQYGITSVPTFIVNQKYTINGGQPPEVFMEALQQILNEDVEAA